METWLKQAQSPELKTYGCGVSLKGSRFQKLAREGGDDDEEMGQKTEGRAAELDMGYFKWDQEEVRDRMEFWVGFKLDGHAADW